MRKTGTSKSISFFWLISFYIIHLDRIGNLADLLLAVATHLVKEVTYYSLFSDNWDY